MVSWVITPGNDTSGDVSPYTLAFLLLRRAGLTQPAHAYLQVPGRLLAGLLQTKLRADNMRAIAIVEVRVVWDPSPTLRPFLGKFALAWMESR